MRLGPNKRAVMTCIEWLLGEGLTQQSIAAAFGVGKSGISYYARLIGIKGKRGPRPGTINNPKGINGSQPCSA